MDPFLDLEETITCENGLVLFAKFNSLSIYIDDDTTIDMITEAWWEISGHRRRLSKKYGPSPTSKDSQRLILRDLKEFQDLSFLGLAKFLNDNIAYHLDRGEKDEAIALMLHWGIKKELAIDIANEGVDCIRDDYPFNKEKTRSFIRYSPKHLEEE